MDHLSGSLVRRRRLGHNVPTLFMVVVLGAFVGWLDLTNSEVQVTVVALLLGGFGVGWRRPPCAWLWASALGFSVPVAQAISLLIGLKPPYPNGMGTVLEAFLALIPAFLGTYSGVLVRSCWCWQASRSSFRSR